MWWQRWTVMQSHDKIESIEESLPILWHAIMMMASSIMDTSMLSIQPFTGQPCIASLNGRTG